MEDRTLQTFVGTPVTVTVPEIPSSGYIWKVTDGYSTKLSISEEYVRIDQPGSKMVSSEGERTFIINPKVRGTYKVIIQKQNRPYYSPSDQIIITIVAN